MLAPRKADLMENNPFSARYALDPLHAGIRVADAVTLFGMAALALVVILPFLSSWLQVSGIAAVALFVVGTGVLSLGSAYLVDHVLRSVWPSGRWFEVSSQTLVFHEKDGSTSTVSWGPNVTVLSWYFVIQKGRAWVPKGWYCVACQLTQGERAFTPYVFLKPEQATTLPHWHVFKEISRRKELTHEQQSSSEQMKLQSAEQVRWTSGVEMLPDDFSELISTLTQRLNHWPYEKGA